MDFFCGAGGMTYGLRQAGIKVLAGIDNDLSCKETYEYNNPGSLFIGKDITEYTPKELETCVNIRKNQDNLIFIACSPCQYWSQMNTKRDKAEKSKNLLEEFQRFVEFFKPGYIVIENVPGLFRKTENALHIFMDYIKQFKYESDEDIISAHYYGVPQKRRRFLLIASRVNGAIRLPEKEINDDLIVRNYISNSNGFEPISAGYRDTTPFMHTSASLSVTNLERIKSLPPNCGSRLVWKKNNPDNVIPAYRNRDNYFRNVYTRMSWNKPAPTITTRFNSFSNGRFGHPEEDRAISLREGATLQTFPKTYVFKEKNMATIARHIGNAVPPELACRIGLTIKESYKYASI